MNEMEAWELIVSEWRKVKRMKKLNQELYDMLGSEIVFNRRYSQKHGIPIPDSDVIKARLSNIHSLMDEINAGASLIQPSDELLQEKKKGSSDDIAPVPSCGFC
jgi:hypothetical protein